METTPDLTLVACVSQKLDRPSPAADLYRSDWFVKARAYVEAVPRPWLILSAKHGAVEPSAIVATYDVAMADHDKLTRAALAEKIAAVVLAKLVAMGERTEGTALGGTVEILAGVLYREHLVGILERAGCTVVVPMQGLGIGQQKRWLKMEAAHLQSTAAQAVDPLTQLLNAADMQHPTSTDEQVADILELLDDPDTVREITGNRAPHVDDVDYVTFGSCVISCTSCQRENRVRLSAPGRVNALETSTRCDYCGRPFGVRLVGELLREVAVDE